jgi:pantoate--beta-alanine ligase
VLRQQCAGERLGLVPTMGALHEGHMSLVRAARARCSRVVASLFVNPTQFAPGEDFAKYPRTFEADCALLQGAGVDYVFAPTPEEMYPPNAETFVDVPKIGSRLDGASRPGHFRGVATVVAKLFNIVQPDRAFFGQKDAAQVAVLRAMVRDLNFDIDIVVCPTVRDDNGLALSSRNRYLSTEEHKVALKLSRSLRAASEAVNRGDASAASLQELLKQQLSDPAIRVDYTSVVDALTLEPVDEARPGTLIAVAAFVGSTRLIDNVIVGKREETVR